MQPASLLRVLTRINEIENLLSRVNSSSNTPLASRGSVQASSGDSVENKSFEEILKEYADQYQIDVNLLKKLIQVESGGNARAVSPKGAMGLMQLMPQTCRMLGVKDPFDVRENIAAGTRYLRSLIDRFGSLELALAAYNAGPSRVEKYQGVPPFEETRTFLKKILGGYY
ncbi:MAG: lytic transglycosylase domain-containing protein [Candidatus Atribacteria bacterium]|nr:lytic transglycosylase domain-containing protein [Candidatus Atribacteria bacterium]MCD6349512.1 lytic transglycosylase domain-containing protein [Candidatus Atribacteria bacterium]